MYSCAMASEGAKGRCRFCTQQGQLESRFLDGRWIAADPDGFLVVPDAMVRNTLTRREIFALFAIYILHDPTS